MPYPGGGADKAGNRYELRWTVRQFIRLLTGEVAWIHLEPIGSEGDHIEFRLARNDGQVEVHQVKRQQADRGHWTINDLARVGVLDGVRRHAVDGDAEFVFVSTQAPKSLPELCERAKTAADMVALRGTLSLSLLRDIGVLRRQLGNVTDEQVGRALQRSSWTPVAEHLLLDTLLALLGAYLTGEPEAALAFLASYALSSLHRQITPQDLWIELERVGFRPTDVAWDRSLVVRLRRCREAYLQSQDFSIGGLALPRVEAESTVASLLEPSGAKKTMFVVGPAGVGKTGVVAQIVAQVTDAGWWVLPFRLDRLDSTRWPADIGRQVLGREKSPVAVLAGLANGEDCLLVIEQLDAVSVVSGRQPEFFDAVDALVREAWVHPNIRVLLACRTFDLENDPRLRNLREREKDGAKSIAVGPLGVEQVKTAVAHLGLSPDSLTPSQVELLSLPLHLALLAGITGGETDRRERFGSAKDLYDAFWMSKRTAALPQLNDGNAYELLLHALAVVMNDRKALSVPRGLLPPGDADLDRLVSAHVLIRQGSRLGFFHESFFDYVFARFFCEGGAPLREFLLAAEQDLFRRSQVRQILAYRRDDDFDAHLQDLQDCLAAPAVRFHIKKLMIGVVGQVADPRQEEWEILEAYLREHTGSPTDPVRDALWPSAPWFRHLHEQGILRDWLLDERAETQNFAFNWLARMAEPEPERVADLLERLAGRSQEQDERILNVLVNSGIAAASERSEALFHSLACSPDRGWEFTSRAYQAYFRRYSYGSSSEARVACRALGRWMRLLGDDAERAEAFADGLRTERGVISDHQVAQLAKSAPEALVESALEPFLALLERAAIREGEPPFKDRLWRLEFGHAGDGEPESLTMVLVTALRQVAKSSPKLFQIATNSLQGSECRTAHRILLRALANGEPIWTAFAVDYLAENWNRRGLWYGGQARRDCRCLLRSLGTELSKNDVARLEPFLLDHFENWRPSTPEERQEGTEYRRKRAEQFRERYGREQFELLGALPLDKLSTIGRRRVGELSRKAASMGWTLERPRGIRGGFVQSPLPKRASERMTDAQWLAAIQEYADDREREWLEDRVLGGARELARELEKQTKTDPLRFARLMLALPDDANEHYFEAIVMGLREGGLPLDLLRQVVIRTHDRPERPHGRWIPDMIASHGDSELDAELLDVVTWYATQDPDPDEELWSINAGGAGPYYGGSPYGHGINTARGSAARAVAGLIARDRRYWIYFDPVLESMVGDSSIAVRSCVAEACTQVLRYDRPRAVELFLSLCDAADTLLATNPIEHFLYYTADTEFRQVRPILERMLASPIPEAREAAARQVTLAALSLEEARLLADAAMGGDPHTRKGVAEVMSRNIHAAPDPLYLEQHLVPFFEDPSVEVRRAAGGWTRREWPESRLGSLVRITEAFVESQAFADGTEMFFRSLEEAVDVPSDLLLRAGQRFVEVAGTQAGDLSRSAALVADVLSKLVLRAYRQAERDPGLRSRCLDLFDHLLEVGGYGADQAMQAFER